VFNRGVKAVHDSIMAESQTQESETTGASDRRVCVCVCVWERERERERSAVWRPS